MKNKLHIAVACGGTGGHIFPGLATARALRDRGHHVTLWLAGKGVEHTALQGWKGRVVTIPTEGFQFGPLRSLLTAFRIGLAVIRCLIAMIRHRPHVVLAMGSYASIGPCLAASLLRIPVVLHEANAVPGKAVRLLAGRAAAIGICFEESRYHLKRVNVVQTGMPLREELRISNKESRIPKEGFSLLVMGGSAGAHSINTLVPEAAASLVSTVSNSNFQITHLTGPADAESVRMHYADAGVNAEVFEFVQEMAALYETADLAICRAGASTCAELGVFAVPALLIPYPYAAGDHQTANAHALEKLGAADLIQEADCTVKWLADYIRAQIEDPDRLRKMREHAACSDALTAAEKLAELVEQCVQK